LQLQLLYLRLYLHLLSLVILSVAKNPCIFAGSEATECLSASENKFQKSAYFSKLKKRALANHLYLAINHALSAKNHAKQPIFRKNPLISPHPKKSQTKSAPSQVPLNKIHFDRVYTSKDMSTSTISVDEFQALEQKVLRAVEIIKQEREARAKAEAEVASLNEQLEFQTLLATEAQASITTLNKERDGVRLRVEKMLQQMDELL
jgi:hypothetical protein